MARDEGTGSEIEHQTATRNGLSVHRTRRRPRDRWVEYPHFGQTVLSDAITFSRLILCFWGIGVRTRSFRSSCIESFQGAEISLQSYPQKGATESRFDHALCAPADGGEVVLSVAGGCLSSFPIGGGVPHT